MSIGTVIRTEPQSRIAAAELLQHTVRVRPLRTHEQWMSDVHSRR